MLMAMAVSVAVSVAAVPSDALTLAATCRLGMTTPIATLKPLSGHTRHKKLRPSSWQETRASFQMCETATLYNDASPSYVSSSLVPN